MIKHPGRKAKFSSFLARSFVLFNLLFFGMLLAVARAGLADRNQGEFQTSYFDVATSQLPSAGGYGGLGLSGGAGDSTVRVINPTAANGSLCAMIYVFDDREEMQTCCGCPVSPDGQLTVSTINNLTFNFGVNGGNLNAGVIKIVSSKLNFTPGAPPPAPLPPGTNGALSANLPLACSPTGSASNDPFRRASAVQPVAGLRSWITRDELLKPGAIVGGRAVQSVMTDEFQDSPLDGTELNDLQHQCAHLITNGSGTGTCTCGLFPPPPPPPPPPPTQVEAVACLTQNPENNPFTVGPPSGSAITNDLALVAISVPAGGATVTSAGSNPGTFTQIESRTSGAFTLVVFSHPVVAGDSLAWQFTSSNPNASCTAANKPFPCCLSATTGTCGPEAGVVVYRNTCLDNGVACSNPIDAHTGAAQTATTIATGGPVAIPTGGMTVAIFGSASLTATGPGTTNQIPTATSMKAECGGTTNADVEMEDNASSIAGGGPLTVNTADLLVDPNAGTVLSLLPQH